jgi:nucleoside-diphosphate-sugar epimerase
LRFPKPAMPVSRAVTLVTGGAGFIGAHLVERLIALGHRVRVVDNLSTGKIENLASVMGDIEFLRGDLRDATVCRRAVRSAAVVFHLAAVSSVQRSLEDPWGSHDANVNATLRLLIACAEARVRRVVYSSSSSAYGDAPGFPKVESAEPLPSSLYAAAKLAAEQYVLAFARAGQVEGIALRYFNVFGPRQDRDSPYAAVIPAFLSAAHDGRTAVVFGDGRQTRDFVYVTDVVEANILAATAPAERTNGTLVNIGAGQRTSLLRLIELMRAVTGRDLRFACQAERGGDVRDSLAGLERAQRVIGYQPRVSLREGLRLTWEWFADAHGAAVALPRAAVVARAGAS